MYMPRSGMPPGNGPHRSPYRERSRAEFLAIDLAPEPDPTPAQPQLTGDDLPPSYTFVVRHVAGAKIHLLMIVEYASGDVIVVSDVGVAAEPNAYTTTTPDGSVRMIETRDWPFEMAVVHAYSNVRSVVPVIYSPPRNQGYSFHALSVQANLYAGVFNAAPPHYYQPLLSFNADSEETEVAFFVPTVLHPSQEGWVILNEYGHPRSPYLPTVLNGQVTMDSGPTMYT